jgi:uridine phosphorylase
MINSKYSAFPNINDFSDEGVITPKTNFDISCKKEDLKQVKHIKKYIVTFSYMNHLIDKAKTLSWRNLKWHPRLGIIKINNEPIGFMTTRVCAPATIVDIEEMIYLGARFIILTGGVGVLYDKIRRGNVIIPEGSIRDEGSSFHYLPANKKADPSDNLIKVLRKSCEEMGVKYHTGKVWTTDAAYRETPTRIRKFKKEGAVCVDMEAAACFAVARFRRIDLAALFYGGDLVHANRKPTCHIL